MENNVNTEDGVPIKGGDCNNPMLNPVIMVNN